MLKISNDKLKELIIYIAAKCSVDISFGVTKLNKILFFSDFLYYLKRQKSISNHKYVHLQYGPVPDNIDILMKQMLGKDIGFSVANYGPFQKKKIVALREPKLDSFRADEISFIDSVIDKVCFKNKFNAVDLTLVSHEWMGWLVTDMRQIIPYETVFLKNKSKQTVSSWEKMKASELIKNLQGQYGFPKTS